MTDRISTQEQKTTLPSSEAQTDRIKKGGNQEPCLNPSKEFFIILLKKIESFEFTVNMNRILNNETKEYIVELSRDLFQCDISEKNSKEFVQKCGVDNFEMMKCIYVMYKSNKCGMQKKDFLLMIKDFEILKNIKIKNSEIEVIFTKFAKKNLLSLKSLIEIFFQLYRIKTKQKSQEFRVFFKEILYTKYNEYRLKIAELNLERIFIFNKNQSVFDDNIIFELIYDFKDVLSHVYLLF